MGASICSSCTIFPSNPIYCRDSRYTDVMSGHRAQSGAVQSAAALPQPLCEGYLSSTNAHGQTSIKRAGLRCMYMVSSCNQQQTAGRRSWPDCSVRSRQPFIQAGLQQVLRIQNMGVGLARLDLIASAAIGDKISGSDTPASGALLLTTAQGFPFQWNERQTTKKTMQTKEHTRNIF